MEQLINQPTREQYLLDLLITDSPNYFVESGVLPPISNLDHSIIYGYVKTSYCKNATISRKIWLYDEGNYDLLNSYLFSIDWNAFFAPPVDIDELAKKLTNILTELSEMCIPSKTIKLKPKDKLGITFQVKKLFKQAKRLHKRAKRSGSEVHYRHFKLKRAEAKSAFKISRDKSYIDIADKLADPNTSSKAYWRLSKLAYG